jgi:adenine-specific DNA-methyltransferase
MQDEYREKVKCIYIDPPYNTGNDGFVYKDSYQSASWLSMMQDRLLEAKHLMSDNGVIFTSMDDSEITNLENIQKNIF